MPAADNYAAGCTTCATQFAVNPATNAVAADVCVCAPGYRQTSAVGVAPRTREQCNPTTCVLCPAGSTCAADPDGAAEPVPCAAGTFSAAGATEEEMGSRH